MAGRSGGTANLQRNQWAGHFQEPQNGSRNPTTARRCPVGAGAAGSHFQFNFDFGPTARLGVVIPVKVALEVDTCE